MRVPKMLVWQCYGCTAVDRAAMANKNLALSSSTPPCCFRFVGSAVKHHTLVVVDDDAILDMGLHSMNQYVLFQ